MPWRRRNDRIASPSFAALAVLSPPAQTPRFPHRRRALTRQPDYDTWNGAAAGLFASPPRFTGI
jgi:hypothetical protein